MYSVNVDLVAINKFVKFLPELILFEKYDSQRTVTVDELLLKEMSP